jgi:hypothetical protein
MRRDVESRTGLRSFVWKVITGTDDEILKTYEAKVRLARKQIGKTASDRG